MKKLAQGHLGKIGYGRTRCWSGSHFQALKISKFQKIYLTESTFCQFFSLVRVIFSDFVPDRVQISPEFRLLGYEFCQKLVAGRVHF